MTSHNSREELDINTEPTIASAIVGSIVHECETIACPIIALQRCTYSIYIYMLYGAGVIFEQLEWKKAHSVLIFGLYFDVSPTIPYLATVAGRLLWHPFCRFS